jgi:hypothetical protein
MRRTRAPAYWKFESIFLQRRASKLSVPVYNALKGQLARAVSTNTTPEVGKIPQSAHLRPPTSRFPRRRATATVAASLGSQPPLSGRPAGSGGIGSPIWHTIGRLLRARGGRPLPLPLPLRHIKTLVNLSSSVPSSRVTPKFDKRFGKALLPNIHLSIRSLGLPMRCAASPTIRPRDFTNSCRGVGCDPRSEARQCERLRRSPTQVV